MDDKLERELSAAVERGPEDPAVKKLIGESAQARAYFNGLLAVDRALRTWPAPRSVSDKDSDAFVDAVLARLDEPVSDRDFDPFAVPFADEREAQKTPRQHSEQHAMSQSNDQDNDDDLEGLAALMRPSRTGSSASVPPPAVSVRPGPALADDAMDESSGIVDIKHLAAIAKRASVPPASVDEALKSRAEEKAEAKDKSDEKKDEKKAEAKSEKPAEKKSDDKKADEKKAEKKDEKKLQAVPAATAAPEASEKKGSNPVLWIGLVGIAAAAAFGVSQMNKGSSASSVNAEAPQSAAPSAAASANGVPAAQPAVTQPPSPTAAPVAPAEGTAAPAQQPAPEPVAAAPAIAQGVQPAANAQPAAAAIGGAASEPIDQGAARRAAGGGGAAESDGPAVAAAPRNAPSRESAGESAPARPSTATGTSVSAGAGASRGSSSATTASAGATTTATPPATRTAPAATTTTTTTTATTGAAPAGGAARPMSVDELMRRATGADRAEEAQRARTNEQAAAQASLPPQLTRSMVSGAMTPFNSQVRACAQGQTGTATAVLTVSGDGSVSNVVVSSPWGSGPNDCITNRLRTARFPAVQRPSSRVVYPFAVLAPQPGG